MDKWKAYWVFHKGTLPLNLASSALFSIINLPAFFYVFPVLVMTSGTLLGLFYMEVAHRNEYIFYYNLGIPKTRLFIVNEGLNILTGFLLLGIFLLWQASWR
jgi:hypothetical protein